MLSDKKKKQPNFAALFEALGDDVDKLDKETDTNLLDDPRYLNNISDIHRSNIGGHQILSQGGSITDEGMEAIKASGLFDPEKDIAMIFDIGTNRVRVVGCQHGVDPETGDIVVLPQFQLILIIANLISVADPLFVKLVVERYGEMMSAGPDADKNPL